MPLQFRRGHSDDLPNPSDASVGEPIFTTNDGKLRIKKANGQYVVINDGSASENLDLSGIDAGSLVKVNPTQDGFVAAAGGDLPSHTHNNATTSVAGFMSASDKTKLDGIPTLGTAAEANTSDFAAASHDHGNVTSDGKVSTAAGASGLVVQTGAAGAITTLAAGTSGQFLKQGSSGLEWGSPGGNGTVTSVDLSVPSSLLSVGGNPITESGTLAISLPERSANVVFAGPTTGAAAAPSFRPLVADDIPSLAATKITAGQIPSAVTFDTADLTGFSNAVNARLIAELPDTDGALDIAQQSTLTQLTQRTITAGTGLTGGGDLTADRTFAVDFAATATAGKAVEANDARLSNERTPVDGSVGTAKIADNAVTDTKIANAAVTMAKIAQAGATDGQVIKWSQDSNSWLPADDNTATPGSGAPTDASYLTLSTNTGLSNERSLAAGTGLTGTDAGANGAYTLSVDYGTTAGTACQGNDGRLSDTRTPSASSVTTSTIVDDAVTYAKIQNVTSGRLLGRSDPIAGEIEEIRCYDVGFTFLDATNAAEQRTAIGVTPLATDSYVGQIDSPSTSKTYWIDRRVSTARTITEFYAICTTGTVTATLYSGAEGATQVGQIEVNSGGGTAPSLTNTSIAANGVLRILVSNVSSPTELAFVIKYGVTL
jgi:hypothetical protein